MASASASAPTTKKSFFKKPTWAISAPRTESGEFFRHSDTVYDTILKEKERRRERHAQKKQAKVDIEVVEEGRENKRRRITSDEEDQEEDGQNDTDAASTGSRKDDITKIETPTHELNFPARHGPAQARQTSPFNAESSLNLKTSAKSKVIELDSDDDKSQAQPILSEERAQIRVSDEEVSEEEDEYVLELKQKAREKARLKKLGMNSVKNKGEASCAPEPQQRPTSSSEDRSLFAQPNAESTPPPNKAETIVQILIDTKIPNAKPLIVNRKASQPLRQVREIWCARQNFSDDVTAQVIFTWRGKRLYDTTTSMHLLNVLKKERARQMGGLADDDDEEDPSNGRIEVEAMTKEIYEQKALRKKREETEVEANGITDPGVTDRQSVKRSTTPKEEEYQVVMNAQGLEALHLKVRPSTRIAKMMAGFKKMRNVALEKTCWLVHDGDRLELDSTVGDTEIEDGDVVEVYVR